MKLELVDIVDKNDRVLKTIERKLITKSDISRSSCVIILNNKNEILLQLRSVKSERYPSFWDCSAGGIVGQGEDYATCADRELSEETGIKTELKFLGKHYIELDDGRRHFTAFFVGQYNGKTKIDPNEVTKVKFFSIETIRKMIVEKEKIHPECLFMLEKYFL